MCTKKISYKPGLFTSQDCYSGEEVAHEAVVEPPRMGYNEADVVRLARPKGKKCRLIKKASFRKSIC
jgi:hypothetical protein